MKNNRRFVWYAWGVVLVTVLVIVWGAFVRATGSGAGCGDHWPLCNGEVLPRAESVETLIEFSHRLTSGLALLAVGGLLIWALRSFPKGHIVRKGAVASMVLIVVEALIGAALVRRPCLSVSPVSLSVCVSNHLIVGVCFDEI